MSAIDLIRKERQRQLEEENWTPDHDDDHREDEIAIAAALPQHLGCRAVRPESERTA